jgi:aminoglycoside 6'-N-acetyltransferase
MTADDLPMAARWLATPEVQLWWGDEDEVVSLEDFDDPNVALWIVSLDGRPFAYVQDYDPHAWPGHPFAFLPRGSRGMDQFIGEPEMIGVGHGSALIRAHAERLFAEGAPAVAADPSP